MSENYEFVSSDVNEITAELISDYEEQTGHTVAPADPDRLILAWIASVITQQRVYQNYIGNQNIPSRAEGENLDALGVGIFGITRKPAQAAKCYVRFTISSVQASAVIIPSGTRVTDTSQTLYWHTTADAMIAIGDLYVDVMVECETAGEVGNGYTAGQICKLVDSNIIPVPTVANTATSDGGTDIESDEEYRAMMQNALSSFSTAGPENAYIYWAKSVSDDIADVKVIRPVTVRKVASAPIYEGITYSDRCVFVGGDQLDIDTLEVYVANTTTPLVEDTDYSVSYADGLLKITVLVGGALASAAALGYSVAEYKAGHVYIYALMKDGTIAGSTIKQAIADACNAEGVRPLTDRVEVKDPDAFSYNINVTYYISRDTQASLADIQAAVSAAISEYEAWQSAKLGRDINPDYLKYLLMQTGIKRVTITSPSYMVLKDGSDGSTPQIASCNTVSATNGGYEDE